MLVELGHQVTCRTAVLTRIELCRFLCEHFADSSGERQTAIGVDVNLADSRLGSLAELLLRNTYCVRQFASVFVDHIYILLRNGRRAVENDREARKLLHYSVEYVKCQWRRNKTTGLRVTGTLLRSELVCSVAGTDGDSQAVAARTGGEINYLFRFGIVADSRRNLILYTCQYAELSLNGYIVLVSVVHYFLGEGDVLLVRQRRSVDHDAGETEVHAGFAEFEAVSVVEVQADLRMLPAELFSVLNGTLSHVTKQGLVSVVTRTFRYLKDHRRFGLSRSFDDRLELLHVVEIECRDGISSLDCLSKHLTGVHKT